LGFKFTDIGANEVHQTEVLVWPSGELAPSRYTGDLDIRDKKRKPRGTRSRNYDPARGMGGGNAEG